MTKPIFNVSRVPESFRAAASDEDFRVFMNSDEDSDEIEILLYDAVGQTWDGEGLTASAVVNALSQAKDKKVRVKVNSPGGLVWDGITIYNALATHDGEVEILIEGLAFSAASLIAMAGDTIKIMSTASIGIHRSHTVAWGNRNVMEDTMDWLDNIDDTLVDVYAERSGQSKKDVLAWLEGKEDGTLFKADDAVKYGFADEKVESKKKKKKKDKGQKKAQAPQESGEPDDGNEAIITQKTANEKFKAFMNRHRATIRRERLEEIQKTLNAELN